MDLSVYFQPVSNRIAGDAFEPNMLGSTLDIYREGREFPELEGVSVALFGVNESRGHEANNGCEHAPDAIRRYFYRLYRFDREVKVVDLGNIQAGASLNDTFYAVSDSCQQLIKQGIVPVVIGGSQGALGLNRMTRVLFPSLLNSGCRVVHLTGSNDPDVGCIEHPLLVERPFSDEIPALLQHADLAISRAGAGSLSELAVSGTPTVLVPFPQAADHHQDANAVCAAAVAAAVIVHQHDPSETTLRDTVWRLLGSRLQGGDSAADPLPEMGQAMRELGVEDADQKLVALLQGLLP